MKRFLIFIALLVVYCTNVFSQVKRESSLDILIRLVERLDSVSKNSAKLKPYDQYKEFESILDSMNIHKIGGYAPALVLYNMILNSKVRKDTVAHEKHYLDLRNRAYNQLSKNVSSPLNFGFGKIRPASNDWWGEGAWMMMLYYASSMELLTWVPCNVTTQYAYEALLNTKGLQLIADNFFKFVYAEYDNENMKDYYNNLVRLQKKYSELDAKYNSNFPKYSDEFDINIRDYPKRKEIKDSIINIKDSIFTIINLDDSYLQKFCTSWFTIQKELNDCEAAIEFAAIPISKDTIKYIALVIDDNCKAPYYYELCDERQLKDIDVTKENSLDKLRKLVWEPLDSLLTYKNKLYFSADGILHKLPIEYTIEEKKIIRLSSIKELLKKRQDCKDFKIVAYGGLDYESYNINLSNSTNYKKRGFSSANATRGTRQPLPWTLVEIEDIKKVTENYTNASIKIYSGNLGTEESFYKLEDCNCNILHIATHGFYYTPDKVKEFANEKENYSFIDFNDTKDADLTHSGLLLSGANHVLRGKYLQDNQEDGILTAKEVASTNLNSFDMVVLSACKTGLGDITYEGVFGLQRGFKKAGVDTILMSLWDIDDSVTQLLMVEFYRQLLLGLPKIEALKKAQQYVRRKNVEYHNPYFWAGFIFIDALN